ncbi:MAG: hypothetical protein GY701_08185 [Sulfitobacter sp.]|nr:hypothetical protein [Sulfitobacter sp.]
MLDLEQISKLTEFASPAPVGTVPSERRLEVRPGADAYRFDMGNRSAMTDHREVLAAVLNRVEEI